MIYKPTSAIYEAITTYEVAYTSTCLCYTQQNVSFGVCLYTGRRTLRSLQRCSNWIVTSARILEVQVRPRVLVNDWRPQVACVMC